jgi:hypothetical protein
MLLPVKFEFSLITEAGEVDMPSEKIVTSLLLFLVAGLCEIRGGWLVWQWLREGRGHNMGACWRVGSNSLRHYPHLSTGSFWQGLRYVRWLFYHSFSFVGLGHGWEHARPV